MCRCMKTHFPVMAAIGILWLVLLVLIVISVNKNHGHLIYALDDAYLHMSVAKNFALYGTWGITPYGFTSSSSSLLWPLLLAICYAFFGVSEIASFILNIIAGTSLVFSLYLILKKYNPHPLFLFVTLMSVIFFAPLPALIFSGMEHVLHALITVAFTYLSAMILSSDEPVSKSQYALLFLLAILLTCTRFEGIFLLFIVSILFMVKNIPLGLCLGIVGMIPIALFGMVSISNGWYFLPNSVLLKANIPVIKTGIWDSIGFASLAVIHKNPHILWLLTLSLAILLYIYLSENKKTLWNDVKIMHIVFIFITFIHMQFADTGWFYRYEAYIVIFGVAVIAISVPYSAVANIVRMHKRSKNQLANLIPMYGVMVLLGLMIVVHPTSRAVKSLVDIPYATANNYQQQYQMGLFLARFYRGKAVAANDVGAIDYLVPIKTIDLVGLGNIQIAQLKAMRRYHTQEIDDLTKQADVEIAMVYDSWFARYGGLPQQWIKVGEWKILNNVVCGGDTVSIYAVDPAHIDNLIENLRAFAPHLPAEVIQSGRYTEVSD
jgi:hypothetical protein